jgi:hypothetical protein
MAPAGRVVALLASAGQGIFNEVVGGFASAKVLYHLQRDADFDKDVQDTLARMSDMCRRQWVALSKDTPNLSCPTRLPSLRSMSSSLPATKREATLSEYTVSKTLLPRHAPLPRQDKQNIRKEKPCPRYK